LHADPVSASQAAKGNPDSLNNPIDIFQVKEYSLNRWHGAEMLQYWGYKCTSMIADWG
jgi:hypothetical protein